MKPRDEADGAPPGSPPGSLAELFHAWRYLFGFLGLILLIVLFYFEENWRGERAWKSYRQEMAARGEPMTAAAFVPPLALDAENFATAPGLAQYFMGQAFAPRFDSASSALKPRPEVRSNSWVTAKTDLAAWHAAFLKGATRAASGDTNSPSTNVTRQAAAAGVLGFLAEAEPTLKKLQAASERPRSRFNLAYTQDDPAAILLRHLGPLKHFCQVLRLRASAELALDQTDAAARDVELMLYLADASREEPILVSQLVRIAQLQLAVQPLAEGMDQWSDAQLRAFQERLGRFNFCADGLRTLQAERVLFGCGVIEYVRRSPDKAHLVSNFTSSGRNGGLDVAAGLVTAAPGGWLYFEELNYSRTFAECLLPAINVSARQISPRICRQGSDQIAALFRRSATGLLFRHRFFSALLLPSLSNSVRKFAIGQTVADLAAVACALQRYRIVNGQFPESLAPLSPQFIAGLPHDIVNGQPLRYRRTDSGQYVLYSVGWNEKDDAGAVGAAKNNENPDIQTGDWVWRPN